MSQRAHALLSALALAALSWLPAQSQDLNDAAVTEDDATTEATIDLSVPDSPAFAILGITPESVIQPKTPREFGMSLLQGADPHGTLQSGIALEFTPKIFFKKTPDRTITTYRSNYSERLRERTQISIATAKANDEDDEAMRVALGVHVTLWDKGDPVLDTQLSDCFTTKTEPFHQKSFQITIIQQRAMQAALREDVPADEALAVGAEAAATEREKLFAGVRAANQTCRDQAVTRNQHASNWALGIAQSWLSPDGSYGGLASGGFASWTSFSYGFDSGFLESDWLRKNASFLMHARYRSNELAARVDMGGQFVEQDTLLIALQARFNGPRLSPNEGGGKPRLQLSLDASYREERPVDRRTEYVSKYAFSGEYRLQENTYVKLSIGSETGRRFESSEGFVLAALNWALNEHTK